MTFNKTTSLLFLLLIGTVLNGCFRYSFTGTSIPSEVESIYIPFFANQSTSGVGNLSERLNEALINRFVSQTRLQLANTRGAADAVLEGSIVSYTNEPFSITGEEQTSENEVTIRVRATYAYNDRDEPEWTSTFSGSATYDINQNPIEGETIAAEEALTQVANNIFNDAVSDW